MKHKRVCAWQACAEQPLQQGSPEYLPPAPAQAMREKPTAMGVRLPWPGFAIPQAYTTEMSVNVMMTCRQQIQHRGTRKATTALVNPTYTADTSPGHSAFCKHRTRSAMRAARTVLRLGRQQYEGPTTEQDQQC